MTEDTCVEMLKTKVAVLEEQLKGMQVARELQAQEYSRRLEELNHAHSRAEERNADYLPREMFSRFSDEWAKWRSDTDRVVSEMRGNKTGTAAFVGIILSMIAMGAAAIPLLLR